MSPFIMPTGDPGGTEASEFEKVITYRQLDYWTTRGYLRLVPGTGEGTGNRRLWQYGEVRVAQIMRLCIEAGLTVSAAERVARDGPQLTEHVAVTVRP